MLFLTAAAFAQENLGARPMGMGGAFAGLADDINAIFINPAGISSLQKESLMVSTRVSEGREYSMMGGVEVIPAGNIGIGYVGSNDPIAYSSLDGESPVKYTTQTLYLTFSKDLNRTLRVSKNMGTLLVGMNVKLSSRKLAMANGLYKDAGSNMDIDLASIFRPNDSISLGLSLQNFINGSKYSKIANLNTVEERGFAVLAGVSGRLFEDRVTWTAEGDELGCEIQPIKGLTLRAGRGKDSVTSGIGINLNGLCIDYAYLQKDSPVHYWSISIIPNDTPAVKTASLNLE